MNQKIKLAAFLGICLTMFASVPISSAPLPPNHPNLKIAQRCNSKYRLVENAESGKISLLKSFQQNSEVLTNLETGTLVEFRGWDEKTGQWAHIITLGGLEGWIWGAYLRCDF